MDELRVRDNLPKYIEAVPYLQSITEATNRDRGADDASVKTMREVIDPIKSDPNRTATRIWATGVRRGDALGHKYILQKARGYPPDSDGDSEALVIRGPSVAVRLIRARLEGLVEWDLAADDAALSEFQRARQGDE